MATPIAVFRHDPGDPLGRLEPFLGAESDGYVLVDWFGDDGLPRSETDRYLLDCGAFIFLGGSMSVDHTGLAAELFLIERALKASRPILGICLGAQMLARVLGAPVYRSEKKEIGWSTVCLTPAANDDPLFYGLAPEHRVFQWHYDTFDLPTGAVHLASSGACAHQAFRWSNHAWGLQFHLEATPAIARSWAEGDGELPGSLDADDPTGRGEELAHAVFSRWVRRTQEPLMNRATR